MAAKKGARYLSLVVPLWDQTVHIIEAPSLAEAVKEARRRWPDIDATVKDAAQADGLTLENGADEPVVLLPIGASPGCTAHECLHATNAVLTKAGVPTSTNNDEAAAYTLRAIVDVVAPWLTPRRRAAQPATPPPARRATDDGEVQDERGASKPERLWHDPPPSSIT